MNINRLQAQLQRVPDQALIGYVQNPDGQVPSFLALAELTRRKQIRNAGQEQGQQAPTQTVAEQTVAETAPGIAQLPVPDTMFNEESYANGGIVSFAGLTGSSVMLDDPDGKQKEIARQYTEAKKKFLAGRMGRDDYYNLAAKLKDESDQLISSAGNKESGVAPLSSTQIYNRAAQDSFLGKGLNAVGSAVSDANSLMQRGAGYVYDQAASIPTGIMESIKDQQYVYNPATDGAIRVGDKRVQDARANQLKKNIGFDVEGATAAPDMYNQLRSGPRSAASFLDNLPSSEAFSTINPQSSMTRDAPPNAPTGIPTRAFTPTDFSVPDISAREVTFDRKAFDALKESPVSAEAEMARYKSMIGENEGLAALKGRLSGMEAKAAKEEEQAPWLALTKAGLAIAAGKSQFPLQNIAEGAGVGISDYAAAKSRLADREEKRFDIQSRLSQAERAEQVAAATFGENSAQHVKAQNRAADLAALSAKTTIETTNASNALTAEAANLKNKLTAKELGITEKRYNDLYNVAMVQAEKTLQGIEKQTIQQQTQILNNLLDEANIRITKLAADFSPTAAQQKIQAEAQYNAIQRKLMDITGVQYTGNTSPAGPRAKPIGSF
jgi:hypothetical protein